ESRPTIVQIILARPLRTGNATSFALASRFRETAGCPRVRNIRARKLPAGLLLSYNLRPGRQDSHSPSSAGVTDSLVANARAIDPCPAKISNRGQESRDREGQAVAALVEQPPEHRHGQGDDGSV